MENLKNKMEENNGYVAIGAFEDNPALMNAEQYYAIRLSHWVFPNGGTVVVVSIGIFVR